MAMMRAYITRNYGENAGFEEARLERPEPGPGEILIKVAATSLNPVDHKLLKNGAAFAPDLPAVMHCDVAGTVAALGEGVTGFDVGDHVYACAGGVKGRDGALAEYMRADARLVATKPASLELEQTAAVPLVAITAWESIVDRGDVKRGDHVLIHGGTGGVGHIAIQLAKLRGATVATTVSTEAKAEIARRLGADEIIYYKDEETSDYVQRLTDGKGFDKVFEFSGGQQLQNSFDAAKINGVVVSIVARGNYDLTEVHHRGLSLHLVFMILPVLYNDGPGMEAHGKILNEVAGLIDVGRISVLIDEHKFTMSQVNEAHAFYASGKHVGKIVIAQDSGE